MSPGLLAVSKGKAVHLGRFGGASVWVSLTTDDEGRKVWGCLGHALSTQDSSPCPARRSRRGQIRVSERQSPMETQNYDDSIIYICYILYMLYDNIRYAILKTCYNYHLFFPCSVNKCMSTKPLSSLVVWGTTKHKGE